ncbi:MAG: type II secretion system F family protein [Candidatus Yonathbacteria bacterium]|nr:type II secretion system F family protein [Candidatus Yonathbacteria bacterium]
MSTFIYEAYNRERAIVHGEYEGSTREEVVAYLIKRDLTPIAVDALNVRGKGKGILAFEFFGSIKPVDIMFLVRNLGATIKAGLSIAEAIDIIIADTEKPALRNILQEAQALFRNGQTLSKGFEPHADLFPPIFMGMLRAGEMSGQLDKTFAELGDYLAKEYNLRSKVKSALTYPVILLIASGGVITLLLVFVLPRLTKAFESSGVQLPFITKVFLGISSMLVWSYTLDVIVLAGLVWFFVYFRTTRLGKKVFVSIIEHVPVASDLIKKVALVRFSRTFGNLIGSGISAVEALELSSQSIGNHAYTQALEATSIDIKNGIPLSEALAKSPKLFPRLLISLVIVGERTGTLTEILRTFSNFYEEEVDNRLKDLTALLEPMLLLIMGVLVGSIAFSIILPIYQLVGHFT